MSQIATSNGERQPATIMRTFVRPQQVSLANEDLARKVAEHDKQIAVLFRRVQHSLQPPEPPKKRGIGFYA
jgi:hypothetical protein